MSGIKGKSGRKPDTKKDEKVANLLEKGLTYRDIAKVVGGDPKSIFRRAKRVLAKKESYQHSIA